MPRRLIYFALNGETYGQLAKLCVESLRLAGQYAGDVRVFTDHRIADLDEPQVIVPTPEGWQQATAARVHYGLTLDFAAYDEIMYLDVDFLATKPVEPLFADLDHLRAQVHAGVMGDHAPTNYYLTPAEREQATCKPVCAGAVAANSDLYRQTLHHWQRIITEPNPTHWRDQHALNALIFRQCVPFKPWPESQVGYVNAVQHLSKDANLLHFWVNSKKYMLDYWEAWKCENR